MPAEHKGLLVTNGSGTAAEGSGRCQDLRHQTGKLPVPSELSQPAVSRLLPAAQHQNSRVPVSGALLCSQTCLQTPVKVAAAGRGRAAFPPHRAGCSCNVPGAVAGPFLVAGTAT